MGPSASSEIIIRRSTGKSLVVKGRFHDKPVNMIVDTAAMLTLVNEKLMPDNVQPAEIVTLRGVGNILSFSVPDLTQRSKSSMELENCSCRSQQDQERSPERGHLGG